MLGVGECAIGHYASAFFMGALWLNLCVSVVLVLHACLSVDILKEQFRLARAHDDWESKWD